VATTTQFNGQNVLDGSLSATQFQVGANANQTIDVSIASAKGADIGNYTLTSETGDAFSSAAVATAVNNVAAQNLEVSGNGTSATVAVALNASTKDIADDINAVTSTTGVSAEAQTQVTLDTISTGTVTFELYGSNTGDAVSIGATISDTSDLSSLAAAINAQTTNTGITATASGGEITLKNKEGYDIRISNFDNTGGGSVNVTGQDAYTGDDSNAVAINVGANGANETAVGGTLRFASASGYTVTTDAAGSLFAAATPNASALDSVAEIDVSSTSGANDALAVVDAALTSINNSRASLGAIQNRFASTISNLQTTSENLSASRSRIQDTDFASETANLTRGQILQQAGTAILAQANSLPNGVLALLRG
jgi:flagellin